MAQDFYVSPSGSNVLDGLSPTLNYSTKTGPFKTLTRAQQAIRDLKAAGKFNEAITVHIGKGSYQLSTALEFNDRDSGLPGQEIIWQGEKGATILSGGILLKSCQQFDAANPDKILSCPVSNWILASINGETNTRMLGNTPVYEIFVNEHRMHPARWPDRDWAHIRMPLDPKTRFSVFEEMPQFTGKLSKGQVHIFAGNDTFDQYVGVSTVDLANNQIKLSSETQDKLASGRRFYLQNIEAALDTPEEWFYDRSNNRILLIPPVGITPSNIVISSTKNLIKMRFASHISFSNLTFRHSSGHAIRIDQSDSILLDNLEINNVGGIAIRAPNNTNVTISNNHIHDTGQGGILLSGGDRPTLQDSGNLIENNYIHDYDDVLFNNSPAIDIGGVGVTTSHNLIENSSGNAIVLTGNDHLIEKNEISRICQQSADCGAIHSGRDWTYRGNIIRYNYLHDFSGYELDRASLDITKNILKYVYSGARGIYLDDGVSGFTVFGNILDNANSMSIQMGGGRDNRIENNIIKTNGHAITVDQRWPSFDWNAMRNTLKTMPITSPVWLAKYPELVAPMAHDTWPEGNSIQRNIIISTALKSHTFQYWLPTQGNTLGDNLVWDTNFGIRVDYKILDHLTTAKSLPSWTDWVNEGIEINSLYADPCLDISGGILSLTCSNSPLDQIGFQTIPSDIGLIK
jgi:hypothetical protein